MIRHPFPARMQSSKEEVRDEVKQRFDFRRDISARVRAYLRTPAGQYRIIGLIYLILITAAEAITTLWEPQLGLVFHGIVLVILILHGSLIHRGVLRRFLILLSIAPLIRILSLSLPLQKIGLPLIYWYLVIGVLLFLSAYIASRVTDLRGSRIGWSLGVWPIQLGIGLLGFGLGYIEYLILQPGPLAAYVTWVDVVTASLILMFFTGLLEEYIFRGLMQSATMQVMGKTGLVYIALLFAVLHFGYHSLIDVVFVLLVGLLFGWLVWKTQSLLGASLAHGIANISLYVIFPLILSAGSLPVSSTETAAVQDATPAAIPAPTPTAGIAPPQSNLLVDDRDPGFVFVGANIWLDATGGYGGGFRWAYAVRSVPDVVATWVPPLSGCGRYRVEAYVPSGAGLTQSAQYTVNHRRGSDVVVVNQALSEGTWMPLGIFEFEGASPASVQLSNRTGEEPKLLRWVGFDGMRWIYLSGCTAAPTLPTG
jgi:membrane protease YdiL (CAAX protease family)